MQTLIEGTRGIGTLVTLNWDRLVTLGVLALALYLSGHIALS